MNPADALDLILIKHFSQGGAATTITDYIDDPAAISSPSLITALDALLGDEPEITEAHELIKTLNPSLAADIALRAELCNDHSCDPENCADDH